jgi:hypothetical protein
VNPRSKRFLAGILWAFAAVCAVSLFRELPWAANADYRDFNTYYLPAQLLRQSINPYAGNSVWGDTPSWLLCFEPLTLLAPFTAYKVWFGVNLMAFAIALILLVELSGCGRLGQSARIPAESVAGIY